jgi:hypothetical protein
MKNVPYQFSILRYVHDTVTQEFVNIGVAVFAPEAGFLRARCTESYARISNMFQKIDGQHFRQIAHYIETQICNHERQFVSALRFEQLPPLDSLLAKVLPADDSAFQFSRIGVGLSPDPSKTLEELFQRYVEAYVSGESKARSDDDVWRSFREPLDRAHVTPRLKAKRIVAPNFEYEFKGSWKNEILHVYEPVSFDLADKSSLLDKANRWLGRAETLMDSPEKFAIYLLLGEPRDEAMKQTFHKAKNILNKIPGKKELISESEREPFAEQLAREIAEHPE